MKNLNPVYRTHTCGQLRLNDVNSKVRLSGWIHKKRDHGGFQFIDLRDTYGITQLVVGGEMADLIKARLESVITVEGYVKQRPAGTENHKLATGEIEISVYEIKVENPAEELPIPVAVFDQTYPEDMRLKYRFLDLRRQELHDNILLRSDIIATLRDLMREEGFREFQTPILTASSPEGARDFLVPSRLHPGKFYALPQAPQQFKQLLMVSGFDRYFQIAPCFRDEASRSDRSPGEFYQLDLEMSFIEQQDVFDLTSRVVYETFRRHTDSDAVIPESVDWPKIPYRESISRFGSDKPDLRNPLEFKDVSEHFRKSNFGVFANLLETDGNQVWAIVAPGLTGSLARGIDRWAREQGQAGVAAIYNNQAPDATSPYAGPVAKAIGNDAVYRIKQQMAADSEDGLLFVAGKPEEFYKFAGLLRTKIAQETIPEVFDDSNFQFCWVVDFPMYELDDNGKVAFSHNPFSMPQGPRTDLKSRNPLDILAYQYDLVCNGIELSSGAIRNHEPETLITAFEIAGYTREEVEKNFSGMLNAFRYGAPPHGGIAPGVDRMVMLISGAKNIREIIAFPLDAQGRDLMMNAPNEVTPEQLRELRIKNV